MAISANKFAELAQWFGSALGVIGAILISLNIGGEWVLLGFTVFLISNFALVYWSYVFKAYGILAMQVVYIFIDTFGIWRWFDSVL